MAHERLGLFDTPPNRRETQFAAGMACLLLVSFVLILVERDVRLREVDAFIPMIDAIMFPCELIIAANLYAQAAEFRSRALTVLASAIVFGALLLVPHLLTFPGAFSADGLLGAGINTTAWIYTFRRAAFPIAVMLYVHFKQADAAAALRRQPPGARIALSVIAAIALAAAVTLLTTIGHDLLPPFFSNRTDRIQSYAVIYQSVVAALCVIATAMLFRKRRSVMDLWLLVAMSAWLTQALLNVPITARFTLGWYCLFGLMLASDLILMLALAAETGWLYSRLALSIAARDRERADRLMAMDAVTAAISHEVGQPLTTISLNTAAAMNWLKGPRPSTKKAIKSLGEIRDAGQRTFDVIKSVRATFANQPDSRIEFDLNDLVLETASLLAREMEASKVSLRLSLDETVPPIWGDRVQVQRVLVNLLTNAIESLTAVPVGRRQIGIRSECVDGEDLLLRVSDTGVGIAPENMDHVFDLFFTTKPTGTGLGLPLCRTIAEAHGGSIWAEPGEQHGAMFHLRLPLRLAVAGEETDHLIENLESSLRSLGGTKFENVTELTAELQHVVEEVRLMMRRPRR